MHRKRILPHVPPITRVQRRVGDIPHGLPTAITFSGAAAVAVATSIIGAAVVLPVTGFLNADPKGPEDAPAIIEAGPVGTEATPPAVDPSGGTPGPVVILVAHGGGAGGREHQGSTGADPTGAPDEPDGDADDPTAAPPTASPAASPTPTPGGFRDDDHEERTASPTPPAATQTPPPTAEPTARPTREPTPRPTREPTPRPTADPTPRPTPTPDPEDRTPQPTGSRAP